MTRKELKDSVPIWERATITVEEAAAYTGIGINKLREMTNRRDCQYVLWVGSRNRLIKRKAFEEYLEKQESI